MFHDNLRTPAAVLMLLVFTLLGAATVAVAADEPGAEGAPLFINLITDDPHRADMALSFGKNQLAQGHPLTVFLNDRGVYIAAKQGAERFGRHQAMIAELQTAGAKFIVCPMCMQQYGVAKSDLLDGLEVGNPVVTGEALFAPNTRTLTW